ncbi:hypothetical protein PM082_016518 [Marasmius tenuissimus]|nr:hypothetical protein PM082_016518 [Marasmius tenuissimus]
MICTSSIFNDFTRISTNFGIYGLIWIKLCKKGLIRSSGSFATIRQQTRRSS